ncbi:unnamed protein product [Caenorhabditis angaria]|uniref:F-box domain-containing protein n=1 Tax=Caenorhabditis angaria TaxID=860376 RepID=A0A9P1I7N2_9PELO|nr:unnamed protein product [Caenorhabditis angaria]
MSAEPKKPRLDDENVSLEENKAETTGWFDIPYEMRKIVIDEMDIETRCRFSICSKKCEEEAKMSQEYLKSLKICRGPHPELYIGHETSGYHFCMEFLAVSKLTENSTIVIYKTTGNRRVMKWSKIYENEKAEDVRNRYLHEILEKHHKSIVKLSIDDTKFVLKEEINLKTLKNLRKIFDRTGRDLIKYDILDVSQILRANIVRVQRTNLTRKDLMGFQGTLCEIRVYNMSLKSLAEFVKSLKTGKSHRNLRHLKVYWKEHICAEEVADELNIPYFSEGQDNNDDDDENGCWFNFDVCYDDKKFKAKFSSHGDHFEIRVEQS